MYLIRVGNINGALASLLVDRLPNNRDVTRFIENLEPVNSLDARPGWYFAGIGGIKHFSIHFCTVLEH